MSSIPKLPSPTTTTSVTNVYNGGGGAAGSGWHTAGCVMGAGAAAVIAIAWIITRLYRPRPPAPILPTASTGTGVSGSALELAPAELPPPAYQHGPPALPYGPYVPSAPYPYYPYQQTTYIIESGAGGEGIGAAIAANAAGAACNIM